MSSNVPGPLVLDVAGTELSAEDKEIIAHPQTGGLILFSRNFIDAEQLTRLVRSAKKIREDLLVCVDHEGGRVQRFREGFTHLPAMASLGKLHEHAPREALSLSFDLGWLLAAELLQFDVDLSFAPVMDLDESFSDIIGDRSFSSNPDVAISLLTKFLLGMKSAGMKTCAKHFPGHGGVKADSHLELPVDKRSFDQLQSHDLRPFAELKHHYDSIMTAHIAFPDVDTLPVSFSRKWISEILLQKMGFKGVIFSDDLSMKGAAGVGGAEEKAALALDAGCTSILLCNNRGEAEKVLEYLELNNRRVKTGLKSLLRNKSSYSAAALTQRRNVIRSKIQTHL